ncbi:MAG TPA: hypothetical protein VGB66_09615, partial [Longimicrobium sp.]
RPGHRHPAPHRLRVLSGADAPRRVLREFSGMDGLAGVLFSGGPAEGPFAFWIDDDVEFV